MHCPGAASCLVVHAVELLPGKGKEAWFKSDYTEKIEFYGKAVH